MRRIIPILATAILLVTASTADAVRRRHKPTPTCHLGAHSQIVIADSRAMVYLAPEDAELPEFLGVYGCVYGHRHAYLLGSEPRFSSQGGEGIGSETIAGTTVAFQSDSATSENARRTIVVVDLRTGRSLRSITPGGPGFVTAIVVKSDGAVAWIVETKSEPASAENHQMKHSEYAVEAADKSGNRVLATGPGIDPSSLALAGSTLYWTQGGKPASTMLN